MSEESTCDAASVKVVRPLTIGIAACSSEGAALCYRTICAGGAAFLGPHAHPDVVLHAPSLSHYVEALDAGDLDAVAELMLYSAGQLDAAGADFLICPDNTIHEAMDLVRPFSPLPWLHIAEIVAAEARRRNVLKAAILGTRWLTGSDVYPQVLQSADVGFLRPEEDERADLSRVIMEELVYGIRKPSSVRYVEDLITRMKGRGCDAVILGCTELPLIIDDRNSALPTLDSTYLLAAAALVHAISNTKDERAEESRE